MLQKLKKGIAILTIIVLLPYIITIFIHGNGAKESHREEKNEFLNEYCIGLLAKEVSSDYEEEMLKVQALLVRTTVYQKIKEQGIEKIREEYQNSKEEISPGWRQKLKRIWEDTDGQVIMYQDQLALVPFHQVSNGKTRTASEVLGSEEYPYLQTKECPKDVEADKQMASKFIEIKGVKIVASDSVGYVTEVSLGEETVSGENFRDTYKLASSCFELQEFSGNTRVTTKGVGHGLGLSQYTANEMAKEGKSYKEILQYFFEGTEIKEVAEIL